MRRTPQRFSRHEKRPYRFGRLFFHALTGLLFLLLLFGGYLLFQDMEDPVIEISHTSEDTSPTIPITVSASDSASSIKNLSVLVRYQGNEVPVVLQSYADKLPSRQATFTLENTGLKHGDEFILEIAAVDDSLGGFGFGNKAVLVLHKRLDAIPPLISMTTSPPYIRKGGSACVAFSLNKAARYAGIMVNDLYFPAFQQATGDYLCFFAFPYDVPVKEYKPRLVALDHAGNNLSLPLSVSAIDRQFKADSITVTQGFLDAKAAEFRRMVPEPMSDIERFVQVNSRIRRENAATLLEIGKNTGLEMLWQGAFMRMPRSASRAGFADRRTYFFDGSQVDEQTHLGFDLASVKQAAVPAANAGAVVFADYLGIYGYLIVIDHGLGLQSLYSHLSEIGVQPGSAVARGDIIGKTGATGMAGGDHLHFGILVSGLEVTPLEWLDSHWIRDNITDRLKAANIPLPGAEPPAANP